MAKSPDRPTSKPDSAPRAERAVGLPGPPSSVWQRDWALAALLLLAMLLAYQPLWHAGFVWDDDGHITRAGLRSWDGLARIWTEIGATQQYYPLVHTFFWVEHRLWGDAPLGYHLVNVLLHFSSALLLARILRTLEVPGAWLAAALFALHPVQVESVAWVSELKNTLSGVCCLGSALAYLRYDRERKPAFYLISLALFAAGLFAKTVIATLPAALLLLLWWRRKKLRWTEDAVPLAPFFISGIGMGLLTAWVERSLIIVKEAAGAHLSLAERCFIPGRALWFYLGKLVWPHPLIFIYPRWEPGGLTAWPYLPGLLLLAALWLWRRRLGSGPLVALLLFAGMLIPALGFFDLYPFRYSFVADHFQYLACIAPLALAAAGMDRGLRRLAGGTPVAATVVAFGLLTVLGVMTWQQCGQYASEQTLWRATLAQNPRCWLAQNNLGAICVKNGDLNQGVEHFRAALELKPADGESHFNLAIALALRGDVDEAISEFRQTLQITPAYAEAHYNLGLALARRGKVDEALWQYREALAIKPGLANAHYDLGLALARSGQMDPAIAQYRQALSIMPDYPDALNNLGIALAGKRQLEEAAAQFRKAVQLQPEQAQFHYNLGTALALQGSVTNAAAEFRQTFALQPNHAEAHYSLGVALAALGQTNQAMAEFRKAMEIKPDYPEARQRLNSGR